MNDFFSITRFVQTFDGKEFKGEMISEIQKNQVLFTYELSSDYIKLESFKNNRFVVKEKALLVFPEQIYSILPSVEALKFFITNIEGETERIINLTEMFGLKFDKVLTPEEAINIFMENRKEQILKEKEKELIGRRNKLEVFGKNISRGKDKEEVNDKALKVIGFLKSVLIIPSCLTPIGLFITFSVKNTAPVMICLTSAMMFCFLMAITTKENKES